MKNINLVFISTTLLSSFSKLYEKFYSLTAWESFRAPVYPCNKVIEVKIEIVPNVLCSTEIWSWIVH